MEIGREEAVPQVVSPPLHLWEEEQEDSMGVTGLLNLQLPLFWSTLPSKDVLAIKSSCQHGHGM